ncbi:MAG: YihY/virulence factor BrkB family protein [Phycisphaerae bacterium]|nr:YihY/virulence factor BrkB family protein [Phycisphaerae bacterium]
MRIIDSLKQRITRLLSAPGDEIGSWGRFLRFQIQLWRSCGRRLGENNSMAMSAALSYRTIFVLVPTVFLAVLVLRPMGKLEDAKRGLRKFLKAQGFAEIHMAKRGTTTGPDRTSAPATGQTEAIRIDDWAISLVDSVDSRLTVASVGPIGAVLLIWTTITLLTTIERMLNRIFGAPRSRSVGRRTLLYWAAISLGPIALLAAAYAGDVLKAAFAETPVLSWVLAVSARAAPIILGVVLLAAFYKLMPNTHVSFRAALGGAVIAVPLWLLAKWAMALYIELVVAKGSFYGALGLVPLFLIWLNLVWLIFLFGAELAHTAVNLRRISTAEQADKIMLGPWHLLAAAIVVARPYQAGRGPASLEEVFTKLNLLSESAQRLLWHLSAGGIICPVADEPEGKFLLARPAEKIPVAEILDIGCPGTSELSPQVCDGQVARALSRVRGKTGGALESLTLADILPGGETLET